MEGWERWKTKKLKEKGKTHKEVKKKNRTKKQTKKFSKIKTGRDSVLINRKLKRH
jgi:hypothetical protein